MREIKVKHLKANGLIVARTFLSVCLDPMFKIIGFKFVSLVHRSILQ